MAEGKQDRAIEFVQKHPVWTLAGVVAAFVGFLASLAAIWAVFTRQTVPEVVQPLLPAMTTPPFYPYGVLAFGVTVIVGQWFVVLAFLRIMKAQRITARQSSDPILAAPVRELLPPVAEEVISADRLKRRADEIEREFAPRPMAEIFNFRRMAEDMARAESLGKAGPPPDVVLTWNPGAHGLHLHATNRSMSGDAIHNFELFVTDIRKRTSAGLFAQGPWFHTAAGFEELRLDGPKSLYSEKNEGFPFLSADGHFQGKNANQQLEQRRIPEPGVWSVSFRASAGINLNTPELRFEWEMGSAPHSWQLPDLPPVPTHLRKPSPKPPTPVKTGSAPVTPQKPESMSEPGPVPEGEFELQKQDKNGRRHYIKVWNCKAEPKTNYLIRVTDVQWYSPTLNLKGGFLTHEWFRNLKSPQPLSSSGRGKPLPHGEWDYFTLFDDGRIVLKEQALMLSQTNRWRIFLQFVWQNRSVPLLADVLFVKQDGQHIAELNLFQGDDVERHVTSTQQ